MKTTPHSRSYSVATHARGPYVVASNATGQLATGHVHAFKLDARSELTWLKREGRKGRFDEVMDEQSAASLRASVAAGVAVLPHFT